ncbi:hypothetical protein V2J52_09290 [Georgenia sp. MJ173]
MRVEQVGHEDGTSRPIEDFYEYWRRELELVGARTESVRAREERS